jgi:DNA-3-methyladenine glycosylase I
VSDLATGTDGVRRCAWHGGDPLYLAYHDEEWGRPVLSDRGLFERIVLEGFQAGLSWITILRKRDAFREAFLGFGLEQVASMGEGDVERLLGDAGIVRNRAKVEATISNAGRALELVAAEGSLAGFLRGFAVDGPEPERLADLPAQTPESARLSAELKRRGWRFVGPTTMYALMQAVGLVNDHLAGCHVRAACAASRAEAWAPSARREG